ncbi:MAG: cyclophilin-like fold protein [Prevotella sp.]|nr:cyclophilin-like fold protein [Staphylococcus sp.]MCM1350165.1 cyclophilin-like fold protein [Prevotella sp.]
MKKIFSIIITLIMTFGLTACGNNNNDSNPPNNYTGDNMLIAYFSCTETTEGIAKDIQAKTNGTLFEIEAKVPYTADDLKYYTGGRADQEQSNPNARPEIANRISNFEKYDIVFLGYPIWHGQAPKIMYTFLESYNFTGKTIVPFCTSASSGVGSSVNNLKGIAPNAIWFEGRRFAINTSEVVVQNWINELDLNFNKEEMMQVLVKCRHIEIIYALNKSQAAKDLYAQLPLTIEVEPYSNNEIIFYPQQLNPSDAPLAAGGAGVLAYYVPWGNVVMFYGFFNKNSDLYALGTAVSGVNQIKELSGNVTISKVE